MQCNVYVVQQSRRVSLRRPCRCTPCDCSARTNRHRSFSAWAITCVRSSLWTTAAFAPTSTSACRARTVPTTGPRSSSTEVSALLCSWNDSNQSLGFRSSEVTTSWVRLLSLTTFSRVKFRISRTSLKQEGFVFRTGLSSERSHKYTVSLKGVCFVFCVFFSHWLSEVCFPSYINCFIKTYLKISFFFIYPLK